MTVAQSVVAKCFRRRSRSHQPAWTGSWTTQRTVDRRADLWATPRRGRESARARSCHRPTDAFAFTARASTPARVDSHLINMHQFDSSGLGLRIWGARPGRRRAGRRIARTRSRSGLPPRRLRLLVRVKHVNGGGPRAMTRSPTCDFTGLVIAVYPTVVICSTIEA
jgi:hypothetical protein